MLSNENRLKSVSRWNGFLPFASASIHLKQKSGPKKRKFAKIVNKSEKDIFFDENCGQERGRTKTRRGEILAPCDCWVVLAGRKRPSPLFQSWVSDKKGARRQWFTLPLECWVISCYEVYSFNEPFIFQIHCISVVHTSSPLFKGPHLYKSIFWAKCHKNRKSFFFIISRQRK